MFDFIRTHQRWMQGILLILIIPAFVFVGVQSYSSFVGGAPKIATVNGEAITQRDYERAWQEQLDQYRQIMGSQFDLVLFDTPVMRQRVLEQLINQRVLAAAMQDYRFSVSDGKLRNIIAANPAMQDRGRFSPERYQRLLADQGLTPVVFEANLRRALAADTVLDPIGQSAQLPGQVVTFIEKVLTETRRVSLRRYAAANYYGQVQVSESDMQKGYEDHKQQYRVSEQARIEYLVLDEAAASTNITIRDAEIARYYKQNKSRFAQPARRRVSHIMFQIPAHATSAQRKIAWNQADNVAHRAAAHPTKFAELAKKCSQDAGSAQKGGDLGWLVAGMLTPTQQKAIEALHKGEISEVVESPYGFHVFQLTDLQPAHFKLLSAVQDQIRDILRKQVAARRFSEMATKLNTQVYDQHASLSHIADVLGLKVRQAAGITRTGLLPADETGPQAASASPDSVWLHNPRIRQAVFSPEVLEEKQNSGVIALSANTLIVVRVLACTPSHILPFAQVKDKVRAQLRDARAAVIAAKAGEQFLLTLRQEAAHAVIGATSMPEAATKKASTVSVPPKGFSDPIDVSRQNPQTLSPPVLDTIMHVPTSPLPAYAGVQDGNDYVIVRVERIKLSKNDPTAQANLKQQLSSAWGQAEEDAVLNTLRTQYKVHILAHAADLLKSDEGKDK